MIRILPRSSGLTDLVIFAAVVALGVAAWRFAPLLLQQPDVALPDQECALGREACRAELPGGGTLTLEARADAGGDLQPGQPMQLTATLAGAAADDVTVVFTGAEMEMGYNPAPLAAAPAGAAALAGTTVFRGPATIPVCVTGPMTWRATANLRQSGRTVAVPFRFATGGTAANGH
ncbi:hypothetical protein OTERR_20950 [Oryzomicrobium terrae]|uniref:Uncharacterized protein n=1 Tax=Oryzomicrobium terrae TaxID=1735038 RepID=A0A5C1E9B8_9RHOO|nr:hypothetical protein [Oryzomicrobium terrae]QEL65571.1 hypothetical protein OTERR_20950 [Oryzomicrobium terrae]